MRCISAVVPMTCRAGQTIQIKIVDRAVSSVSRPSRDGATMVLSTTAFGAVANPSASSINIEFQQYVSPCPSLHFLGKTFDLMRENVKKLVRVYIVRR